MASSLERLGQARGDVLAASGPDFFRRLREYFELLEGDKKIKAAVGQLEKDFEDAEAEFVRRDEAFVRILVSIRQKLVKQEPKVNDADATRPDRDVADRASSERFHNWIWDPGELRCHRRRSRPSAALRRSVPTPFPFSPPP
jgi:hypothetical protein